MIEFSRKSNRIYNLDNRPTNPLGENAERARGPSDQESRHWFGASPGKKCKKLEISGKIDFFADGWKEPDGSGNGSPGSTEKEDSGGYVVVTTGQN